MPAHRQRDARSVGVSSEKRLPTFRWCALRRSLWSRSRRCSPSPRSVAFEPCFHSSRYALPERVRFDRGDRLRCLELAAQPADGERDRASRSRRPAPCAPPARRAAGSPVRCSVCEFSTIRLPANERSTAWLIVALKPAASTATNADQREPDGQRRRGDQRAPGLADRVLRGQPAGDPAPARRARRSRAPSAGTTR